MSYRAVGRELGIDPYTAFLWVNQLGANCKSFAEVARELKPRWDGQLFADGKAIYVKGVEHSLLLTADAATQDIPVACLAPGEDAKSWRSVFLELRDRIRYPLRGLTLDGGVGLVSAAREVFPQTPLQICLRHAQEAWPKYFTYKYKGSTRGVIPFLQRVDALAHVRTRCQWQRAMAEWRSSRDGLIRCGLGEQVERLETQIPFFFTFLQEPGMLPTNGLMEGIIRQLDRKIDDTDGYERDDTAWNSLKLLIMRYRFHRFTCSRIKGHNGFSPLQLAGVNTSGAHWVRFSQRTGETEA
jgi:hypothetical protein